MRGLVAGDLTSDISMCLVRGGCRAWSLKIASQTAEALGVAASSSLTKLESSMSVAKIAFAVAAGAVKPDQAEAALT